MAPTAAPTAPTAAPTQAPTAPTAAPTQTPTAPTAAPVEVYEYEGSGAGSGWSAPTAAPTTLTVALTTAAPTAKPPTASSAGPSVPPSSAPSSRPPVVDPSVGTTAPTSPTMAPTISGLFCTRGSSDDSGGGYLTALSLPVCEQIVQTLLLRLGTALGANRRGILECIEDNPTVGRQSGHALVQARNGDNVLADNLACQLTELAVINPTVAAQAGPNPFRGEVCSWLGLDSTFLAWA